MTVDPRLLDQLRERLGPMAVLDGAAARERAFADWSEAPAVPPEAVLLPGAPAQVAIALEICARHRQPVTIQGGLTGLAGGGNPQAGEIALSLAKLDAIEEIDEVGGVVVAQAGVTLQQLQDAVAAKGWFFPVDLSARGSSQIGGNAATNAGGNRVIRFGMMREQVLGLEVALPDGSLLTMLDRVVKNNTGIDLKQLFIGSEGALGVITRLSLKLAPVQSASRTVLCAAPTFEAATLLLREARRRLPGLSSFELMWRDYFEAALDARGGPLPFPGSHPLYILVETLGADEGAAAGIESWLEDALENGWIEDAVIAQSIDQAQALWSIREGIGELLSKIKPNIAFDVSVPLSRMGAFVETLSAALATDHPGQQHLFFGHLGDGNLHLLSGPYADPSELLAVEHQVYRAVHHVDGSISAEHGIGIVKKSFLQYSRSEQEIETMRRIKAALDPHAILNRGRIFDTADLPARADP